MDVVPTLLFAAMVLAAGATFATMRTRLSRDLRRKADEPRQNNSLGKNVAGAVLAIVVFGSLMLLSAVMHRS
jgi:hypothetical protein